MAQPLQSAKQSVNLGPDPAPAGPRVSRIRRDPPPPAATVKEIEFHDRDERDRSDALVGILAFAFAIFAIVVAFGIYSQWSPREYAIEVNVEE